MNKRIVVIVLVAAVLVAVIWAARAVDVVGALKRMHGG